MKKVIKTNEGYFTVYGWSFCHDMNLACALPFPNRLNISINKAKAWLKKKGVKFEVVEITA